MPDCRPAPAPADPLGRLLAPLQTLPGVGAAIASLLEKACGGPFIRDLLFHLPESYIDRRARPTIRAAKPGQVATLDVQVVRHEAPQTPRQPWRVIVTDGTGQAEIVLFSPQRLKQLPPGARVLVSGKLEHYGRRITMPHPDHVAATPDAIPPLDPTWPLTAGLSHNVLARAVRAALSALPELPEWHDPALLRREHWPSFAAALQALHAPSELPDDTPRRRLAYDELLAHQVAVTWLKTRERSRPGRALCGDGRLRATALQRFDKPLTPSQIRALREIDADLAAPRQMRRLLQGDVGSGKTLVAALAMLRAVEAGAQAALMAPTEVLAKQHHRTLCRICPAPVALLTGGVKGAARRDVLRGLASGDIPIVIGTHALFQEAVDYRDLALAVIDEQHRFGVDQRLSLGDKGEQTDLLVMTATPIPRTILLTQFGEMDVSRLTEKPAGRGQVRTTLHPGAALNDVVAAVSRKLKEGAQVFWVCPVVAENAAADLAAAEARYAELSRVLGDCVGLAHGQQEAAARDAALAAFAAGRLRVLVATTVIEVGVDVPAANVMVVEQAERFGLAQLHQLRGRVGRGAAASFCLLLHGEELTDSARRRLTLLRDTEDGFVIADEDFRIRGGGDLGTRQSGQAEYRVAELPEHEDLLEIARKDAELLLQKDPQLAGPRGQAARELLRLFDRGQAVRRALRTLPAG